MVTCATLCVSFSPKLTATDAFPKYIMKSKPRDKSIQGKKEIALSSDS